jgi:hypothetical protein
MRRTMAVVLFLALYSLSVAELPAQSFTLRIWIDRGCGEEYHVGDMITVHWEVSHSCQITLWEKLPNGTRRKVSAGPIISGAGEGSKGWTLGDYGYGERLIQASASSVYGEDSDECRFYVVEEKPPHEDRDEDGVPDDHDDCYNPGCYIVDSRGCPLDSDSDGVDDCDDDCLYDDGPSSNDGCPVIPIDSDGDGVSDDQDACYNSGCSIVDSHGCPQDSDNDGVNDCEDDCPYGKGSSSADGCPSEQSTIPSPTPTVTLTPTVDPPQPYYLQIVYLFLFLVAVTVIGVLILVRRSQNKGTLPPTALGEKTQDYDDDTRFY